MRMNLLLFLFRATVREQQAEWLADRSGIAWIEARLESALGAAERVLRLRVFLANHIHRQLVVFNHPHARRLSQGDAA